MKFENRKSSQHMRFDSKGYQIPRSRWVGAPVEAQRNYEDLARSDLKADEDVLELADEVPSRLRPQEVVLSGLQAHWGYYTYNEQEAILRRAGAFTSAYEAQCQRLEAQRRYGL